MTPIAKGSPQAKARIAGVFYLFNIVTGAAALAIASGRSLLVFIAALCYLAVTLVFYDIFKPVNKTLSLIAAIFSLAGCVLGALNAFDLSPVPINNLAFFGGYCLLIGILILKSTFLPRILGVLMAFGGLGWLTFLSPSLAHNLSPFNMFPGILGELTLTLWLLVMGVNVQRWRERALLESRG
jgi:hypothetical protein